jgi:hypothetical protein
MTVVDTTAHRLRTIASTQRHGIVTGEVTLRVRPQRRNGGSQHTLDGLLC